MWRAMLQMNRQTSEKTEGQEIIMAGTMDNGERKMENV